MAAQEAHHEHPQQGAHQAQRDESGCHQGQVPILVLPPAPLLIANAVTTDDEPASITSSKPWPSPFPNALRSDRPSSASRLAAPAPST